MKSLSCKEVLAHLADFIDGELEAELATQINEHIMKCPFCQQMKKSYEKTIDLFKKASQFDPPEELVEKIRNRLFADLSKE